MIKTVLIIMAGLIFIIILRTSRPEYSFLTRLAIIALVCVSLLSAVDAVLQGLSIFTQLSEINETYIKIGIKALGISLVSETASDICKDCGETALSVQVELACRVANVGIALPIIEKLLELSISLIT